MEKNKVIIIGSSGLAKVIIAIIEKAGMYKIIGLIDSYRDKGEETMGYPILGKIEDRTSIFEEEGSPALLVAVGDNWNRKKIVEITKSIMAFRLPLFENEKKMNRTIHKW